MRILSREFLHRAFKLPSQYASIIQRQGFESRILFLRSNFVPIFYRIRLLINKLFFFSFSWFYHQHLKLLYFALPLLIKSFKYTTQILVTPDTKFPTCFFLTQDRSISLSLRLSLPKDEWTKRIESRVK